jgi:hypothetical protein
LRPGFAEFDSDGRIITGKRVLFLLALVQIEPRVLESLKKCVPVYRKLFKPQKPLTRERSAILARTSGLDDDLLDQSELDELEPNCEAYLEPNCAAYPTVYWRDHAPNDKSGERILIEREVFGLSIADQSRLCRILPSELSEMEQGCGPRAGLTSWPGTEPLRGELTKWGERWHLTNDWCLDWALEQLRTWPPKNPKNLEFTYPLDDGIVLIPTPPPPAAYRPQLETRQVYMERVTRYRDQVERLMESAKLDRTPVMRARREQGPYAHFFWLAGYWCCGWSQKRIAEAVGIDRAPVVRAVNGLAKQIGLTSSPTKNDPSWTVERIEMALSKAPPLCLSEDS